MNVHTLDWWRHNFWICFCPCFFKAPEDYIVLSSFELLDIQPGDLSFFFAFFLFLVQSSENVRTKQQMEKELAKVEGIMAGLNQQGQKLQQAMSTIRRSSSSSHLAAANLG